MLERKGSLGVLVTVSSTVAETYRSAAVPRVRTIVSPGLVFFFFFLSASKQHIEAELYLEYVVSVSPSFVFLLLLFFVSKQHIEAQLCLEYVVFVSPGLVFLYRNLNETVSSVLSGCHPRAPSPPLPEVGPLQRKQSKVDEITQAILRSEDYVKSAVKKPVDSKIVHTGKDSQYSLNFLFLFYGLHVDKSH